MTLTYWGGGIVFKNITNASQEITINSTGGSVTIDSSCTAGKIIIQGNAKWTDNSGGLVNIIDETGASLTWMHSKALTIGKFLGLK